MNTQTHALLAVAVVGSMAGSLISNQLKRSKLSPGFSMRKWASTLLIVFGALLPDISLFIMFGYAKISGVPNHVIWSEMYYSEFWQDLGAISNSLPIFLLCAATCWGLVHHSMQRSVTTLSKNSDSLQRSEPMRLVFAILLISLSSLLHVVTDLPLHHDDGHPHFWPFTNWIFSSPVSYWDAKHYAHYWVPVECTMGLALVAFIWKQSEKRWTKGLLFITGLSYPIFALFFFRVF